MVSRRHARIVFEQGRFWVEDLGSANGVHFNEQRVQRHAMSHNDVVRCGSLYLRFYDDAAAGRSGMGAVPQFPPQAPGVPMSSYGSVPNQMQAAARAMGVPQGVPQAGDPMGTQRAMPAPARPVGWGPSSSPPPATSRGVVPGRPSVAPVLPQPLPPGPSPIPQVAPRPDISGPASQPRVARPEPASPKGNAPAGANEARIYELEQQLAAAEEKRKTAEAEAAAERQKTRDGDRSKRKVEQLQADLRRLRGGEKQDRIEELTAQAEKLEDENEELKHQVESLGRDLDTAKAAKRPKFGNEGQETLKGKVREAAQSLNDALSEVRINL
jgi:hypothetical protein